MIYKLETAQYFYHKVKDSADIEELKHYGVTWREPDYGKDSRGPYPHLVPNFDNALINFGTMEQLDTFVKRWGRVIIEEGVCTIYNGYME